MKIADYINALPDSYQKHSQSNNYKLLLLEQEFVAKLMDDIQAVQDTLDLFSATGKTLELYGMMYGVPRGTATDEQYRFLISQKVAQNMVTGDYNSIINAIAVAFDVPVTSFQFRETENPCEVEVLNLPYGVLLNAGMTVEQMEDIINGLFPIGVRLAPLTLSGTFEFGDETYVVFSTGKVISLTDSDQDTLRGLNIYGKTTQDGTPAPDTPVELVSVENPNVTIYSKNLINSDSMTNSNLVKNADGSYTLTKNGTGNLRFSRQVPCYFPKGTYVLSVNEVGGFDDVVRMAFTFDSGTEFATSVTPSEPIVIAVDENIVKYATYIPSSMANGSYTTFSGLMMECGSIYSGYETYVEPQSLSVPYTLRGVPVNTGGNHIDADGQMWITDEIDFERGVYIQRVNSQTISAEDVLSINNSYADIGGAYCYVYIYSEMDATVTSEAIVISDVAKGIATDDRGNEVNVYRCYPHATTSITMRYPLSEGEKTLEEAKETFAGATICYVIATPIETPLTDEEIEAYQALYTYDPTTVIYNDAGADMKVWYVSRERSLEYDEEAGFGNIDQTIGGYLGYLAN